jgi:NAD-reducing hydrogenase small subunit
MKKIKIGLFSFTCDEGCSMIFLEILNKKFFEWKDFLEFKHARILQSKSSMKNLDVVFVEGAISNSKEAEELKKIRKMSKKLVAIGSCAISGAPSNVRNFFDEERKKEIKPIVEKFGHMPKVSSVSELVKVDDFIPGCPADENKFLEVFEKILKEFGVK